MFVAPFVGVFRERLGASVGASVRVRVPLQWLLISMSIWPDSCALRLVWSSLGRVRYSLVPRPF